MRPGHAKPSKIFLHGARLSLFLRRNYPRFHPGKARSCVKQNIVDFCKKLIDWYNENKRTLPWRETRDPYRIWLSETILQQTRVAQGLPYYERFIERFPTVGELALAEETEVLKLWQGLGYYSRARNLHKAAQIIHEKYQDRFPEDYPSIRALPGIGDYTAAAIASFSYNLCYPVMDGNVIRVISRLHGIFEESTSQTCRRQIMNVLNKTIEPEHAGEFNQAIMEFGALACTPAAPSCLFCPFQTECYAFRQGVVYQLPVKKKKETLPLYELHYLLIADKNGLWIHKRGYNDLWRGMFDLPSLPEIYWKSPQGDKAIAAENITGIEFLKHYTQVLSHRRLSIFFYKADASSQIAKEALSGQDGCRKVTWDDLGKLAVPRNMEKFFKDFNLTGQSGKKSPRPDL